MSPTSSTIPKNEIFRVEMTISNILIINFIIIEYLIYLFRFIMSLYFYYQ